MAGGEVNRKLFLLNEKRLFDTDQLTGCESVPLTCGEFGPAAVKNWGAGRDYLSSLASKRETLAQQKNAQLERTGQFADFAMALRVTQVSRGDKTAIELFVAGVRGWEVLVWRLFVRERDGDRRDDEGHPRRASDSWM